MKKMLFATAVAMAFGTTAAFAHHPAADIVDPDIYAMIDENVSDTHAEMTFDDMGSEAAASMGMAAQNATADVVSDVEEVQARGAMGPQR